VTKLPVECLHRREVHPRVPVQPVTTVTSAFASSSKRRQRLEAADATLVQVLAVLYHNWPR